MPVLPDARPGVDLRVKGRRVRFSHWPVRRANRRYGLQARVFATNPWAVIRNVINKSCPAIAKPQALAFRDQAEEYFNAALGAGLLGAKPVLLYYSSMNLVKSYVLTVGTRQNYADAYHGVRRGLPQGGTELADSYLELYPSTGRVNVFDDFVYELSGQNLGATQTIPVKHLLPQVLQGHRLWTAAAEEGERFIETQKIAIKQDVGAKQIWLQIEVAEEDLTRLDLAHSAVLRDSGLTPDYVEVKGSAAGDTRVLYFQQVAPVVYSHRPSDSLHELVGNIVPRLWSNVLSIPPYRKYYLYCCPAAEQISQLPQLASIYAVLFYLGSITRYKPEQFEKLISGNFGAQIEELLTNVPNQFVYLMASEFAKRDVTRAAIV